MKLINWREEGEAYRPGLNLYPPGCRHSLGGGLRVAGLVLYVRWSKLRRRLFVRLTRMRLRQFEGDA